MLLDESSFDPSKKKGHKGITRINENEASELGLPENRPGQLHLPQKGIPDAQWMSGRVNFHPYLGLLGQWPNFKLFGITYLVGKIKFKLFFQGPLAK